MLATPHLLTGAAVVVATNNFPLGIAAALLSHHLLDFLPHYDTANLHRGEGKSEEAEEELQSLSKEDWHLIGIDLMIGLVIMSFLLLTAAGADWRLAKLIFAGAGAGVLADLWDNVPWWRQWTRRQTKFGRWFHRWHHYFHWRPRGASNAQSWLWEILFTAAFIILPLWYLWQIIS